LPGWQFATHTIGLHVFDVHSFPFSCLFVEKCINIWQPDADILCDGRDPTKECETYGMLYGVAETVNKLNKRFTSLASGRLWLVVRDDYLCKQQLSWRDKWLHRYKRMCPT
jgi:hypothetical protein